MTLPRVLEPEAMDSLEEAVDYDSMDHCQVNSTFVDDLLTTGKVDDEVLDLGTGTAQIPIQLCQQCANCRVMAVDLSVSMLDLARYNIEVAGLTDRIMLDRIDAKRLPYQDERFAVVMSNSIVHHIAEPYSVLGEALRVLSRGGLIFFRDLLRPPDEATVKHLVATYAADANRRQARMFEDSLRAALDLDEIRSLVGQLGLPSQGVRATSDRHWTWCAVKE